MQTTEGKATELTEIFLLTIDQVADRLQFGRSLVYQLIRTGQLRSVKVGAARRVRVTDLETYVATLTPAANDD